MNSEMVKEIMPLSKPLITTFVITFEDLNVPLASRILISENSELLCVRDMFFNLDTSQVESAP
jgi:hypothetical protein